MRTKHQRPPELIKHRRLLKVGMGDETMFEIDIDLIKRITQVVSYDGEPSRTIIYYGESKHGALWEDCTVPYSAEQLKLLISKAK